MVEKDNIEFKLVTVGKLPDDLWESVSAFSNADGGTIHLGINESGERVGIDVKYLDKLQRDIYDLCNSAFSHRIYVDIRIENDSVISAYIPAAPAALRPIYLQRKGLPNGARVRIGSSNAKLDDEWVRRFAIAANGGAELMEFNKSFQDYFDTDLINTYIEAVQNKRGEIYKGLNIEQILVKLRAINNPERFTLFGLLAFSKDYALQELTAPTVNIAVTQYSGTSKVNPIDVKEVSIDDREFNSNVVEQFEESLKFIYSKLPIKSSIEESGKRRSYLVIPEVAVRETLANAIVHRDYSTFKGRIQIDIYSDRIEFTNPGRSLIPLNQLESAHPETRNPLLMSYLKDLNITEHRGRGIRTIKESLRQAGLAEPKFENRHDWFIATLYSSAFIDDSDQLWLQQFKILKLSDHQLNALVHCKHNPSGISNSEYREINNMNSVRDDIKAKKELQKLTKLKLLIPQGDNRYRRYVLSKDLIK